MTDHVHLLPTYRELVIPGAADRLDELAGWISDRVAAPWSRDIEHEDTPLLGDWTYRIFERTGGNGPGLRVFLSAINGNIRISNIVPSEVSSLSRDEYNSALLEFLEQYLSPVAEQMALTVELGDDSIDLAAEMTDAAFDALVAFSAAANKSTGSGHPTDRHRWFRFIHTCSDDHVQLDPVVLARWLEADGWRSEEAFELSVEFEFGIGLLEYGG